jgi:hypothetical protein
MNAINNTDALPTVESTRKQIEDNPQARTLAAGIHSLREVEGALRDWTDGEFRAAGMKIENAIHAIGEVELAAGITLTPYRSWLMELQASAAELYTISRQMGQDMEQRPDEPIEAIRSAHQRMAATTLGMVGEPYVANLRQWRDTFESFHKVYTDLSVRRSERLNRFNQLFRAMFIDRHPAYQLYRHWYNVTEHSPEFPAPPTSEPVPHETGDVSDDEYRGSRYADKPEKAGGQVRGLSRYLILGMIGVVLVLIVVAIAGIFRPTPEGSVAVTITDTPTINQTQTASVLAANSTGTANAQPTNTLDPARVTPTLPPQEGEFITPTVLPTPLPVLGVTEPPRATSTPTITTTPEPTDTATNTPTFTATFTPTATPTATLPPQGLQGEQNLLAVLNRMTEYPWDSEEFSSAGNFWRLGIGEDIGEDTILVTLPVDLLETYFGNNAATRIRRVEAEITLTTFNPSLLATNEVFFGAMLQSGNNLDQTVGMHVQQVQPGIINLGLREGDEVQVISQRSVNAPVVRVRLDRNPDDGSISVFFNGEPLGEALPFVGPEAPILPALFVKSGGVIVSVSEWTMTLR